jgi:predicted transposase YbfD/YdcC
MEEFLSVIEESFSELEDYRREEGLRHPLINMIVISVCALIANADSEQDIEEYAEAKRKWFETFLILKHGIPSFSTVKRFFEFIDPQQFEKCFRSFVQKLPIEKYGDHIALDGKTLRSSYDTAKDQPTSHIISAFETKHGITLAQVKTEEKSNEITAIPEVIDMLNIEGTTITIDAMGCQIIDKKGDFALALKSNHPKLYDEVVSFFEQSIKEKFQNIEHEHKRTINKGHGRIEEREYISCPVEYISLGERCQWKGIKSIICTTTKRHEISTDKTSNETRYFISSLSFEKIEKISNAIRNHWGIENSLHYVLDVTFDEDGSRIRAGNAAEVFSVARKLALNILKCDKSKGSIRTKRLRASWDNSFMERLLINFKSRMI